MLTIILIFRGYMKGTNIFKIFCDIISGHFIRVYDET